MFQITEEGSRDDGDEQIDDDAAQRMRQRVQFTEDMDKATATDASTSVKEDAVPLQPLTSDDGYLAPTTRTTADDSDAPYLSLIDSPTDAAASFATTGDYGLS